ncbi:MAG: tetratricopeptide repeat protein, partial [Actinomycetota bacterium]
MKVPRVLAIGMAVSVVAASCDRTLDAEVRACWPEAATIRASAPAVPGVLEVPPQELSLRAGRMIPFPDRRFLLAVADVGTLLAGDAPGEVEARYGDGRWVIFAQGEEVGTLPRIPDFPEALSLLQDHARRVVRREGVRPGPRLPAAVIDSIAARISAVHAWRVMDGLERLDARWRDAGADDRLLPLAARGLTYLQLQSLDRLDHTDPLGGRALAALAIAGALTPADLVREEALLAQELGYTRHARDLGAMLPDRDPVRLLVEERDRELRREAERPEADPLTRYLSLKRVAWGRDEEMWRQWVDGHVQEPPLSLPVLMTGLRVARHGLTRRLAPTYPYVALFELERRLGNESTRGEGTAFDGTTERGLAEAIVALREENGGTLADLARRFERDLDRLDDRDRGPFLDAGVLRVWFGGHFYSALHVIAIYLLDSLSSISLAERLVEDLEGSPPGVASELYRWSRQLARSLAGQRDPAGILEDLEGFACLGERPLRRSFEELGEFLSYGDTLEFAAAEELSGRLDTRPDHLHELAELAGARYDIEERKRLYGEVVRLAAPSYPATQVWLARSVGDRDRLVEMVEDTTLPLFDRESALDDLGESGLVDDATVRRSAELLIEADPERWETRQKYVEYLQSREAYRDALPVVEDWLERHDRDDGFPYIFARTAEARLHYHLGEYDRAFKAIRSVVDSWQGRALGRAALIQLRRGHVTEAVALGEAGVERYPGSAFSRSVLAEILWDRNRYDRAAEVLSDEDFPLDGWEWRDEVAEAFLHVFADRELAEAGAAFAAIVRSGVPSWFTEGLPAGLFERGRPDLAFTLQSQLEATEAIGGLRNPIRAYRYLTAWKGGEAGLDWIRPRIPSRVLSEASLVMYQEQADDLLWDLVPDPEGTAFPTGLWLMRAAAHVRSDDPDPARERALR